MTNFTHILTDNNLDIPELDGQHCAYCGKLPITYFYISEDKQVYYILKKEANLELLSICINFPASLKSIDCDGSVKQGTTQYVTYHKDCWLKEVGIKKRKE